jgi:hypothetical protein
MPDYMARFKVHLKSSTKPEGWPEIVHHDCFWRIKQNPEIPVIDALKAYVGNEYGIFIQQQGVVVMKKEDRPLGDNTYTMDLRIFIPMHMIAYIDAETKLVTGEIPNMRGDGSEGDAEGVKIQ